MGDERSSSERRAESDASREADGTEIPSVDHVEGTAVPVRGNDVDTDQIIPARFMKVVTFDGLGEFAFFDQRFDDEDNEKDHPFNEAQYQDASVMVVNANFGCGSSREHAPQAMMRWGIDGVVGESYAEIFRDNCKSLGIPAVTTDHETVVELQEWIEANPGAEIEIDVEAATVTYGDTAIDVAVDDAMQEALVEGIWDTTALMYSNMSKVEETVAGLPYVEADG